MIANSTMHVVSQKLLNIQNVIIIQPYVKWGPKKRTDTNPENQLAEAESLIRTLDWKIGESIKVPLERLSSRGMIFGTGKLNELKNIITRRESEGRPLTCIFISLSTLKFVQKISLSNFLGLPVMDRYSVVVQILRLHATTNEARLQVALAEMPYIWSQMRDLETSHNVGQNLFITDSQKMMLKKREKNIQQELKNLKVHRELLRNKRKQKKYPVIAVVGYTNCGKTSLIKALTDESSLTPRNQLFATLDVTAHAGFLPCNLEVLYMDTVGFMTDLPTGLIECFTATLEDALEADVIIHVQDVSHADWKLQRNHVEKTLMTLMTKRFGNDEDKIIEKLNNVINVGNKMDLLREEKDFGDVHLISSTTLTGVDELMVNVEEMVLRSTERIKMTIRVPMGSEEMQWLYKNTAVTSSEADPENSQKILMNVVISEMVLEKFKSAFAGERKKSRN